MIETRVKPEALKKHIERYHTSLKKHSSYYLPLFNYQSNNVPEHYCYLCPLCLSKGIMITKENGLSMHEEFSMDHFPPESVGGKKTLLVCVTCNSGAGRDFDFSMAQGVRDMAFERRIPGATMPVRKSIYTMGGELIKGSYPSLLTVDPNKEVEISLKPSAKLHAPLLDEFIEKSKSRTDFKIDMTFHTADQTKVAKAVLKAAYLYCFEWWGYEFAFSYTASKMREVLRGEANYPVRLPTFYLGDIVKNNKGQIPVGVCYLSMPIEWRSFIINLAITDPQTKFSEVISVLVPGPSKEDYDDLARIQTILQTNPEVAISMSHVTTFHVPETTTGYFGAWQQLQNAN